jgi:hypothetical protein
MVIEIYTDNNEPAGKVLDKKEATSILCNNEMLKNNEQLTRVGGLRDNSYYLVEGTNCVIMHVEEGFCILCDYIISGINIPEKLMEEHYGVYQSSGRDWVKNSATSQLIGYDIKNDLSATKLNGQTLDHEGHTFDEREKNKKFSNTNINGGSHRTRVGVDTDKDLDCLINKIKKDDQSNGHGMFL